MLYSCPFKNYFLRLGSMLKITGSLCAYTRRLMLKENSLQYWGDRRTASENIKNARVRFGYLVDSEEKSKPTLRLSKEISKKCWKCYLHWINTENIEGKFPTRLMNVTGRQVAVFAVTNWSSRLKWLQSNDPGFLVGNFSSGYLILDRRIQPFRNKILTRKICGEVGGRDR